MYFVCFCGGLSFILLCFKGLFDSFLFFVYILFPSKLIFFGMQLFAITQLILFLFLIFHHRYSPLECPSVPLSSFSPNIGIFTWVSFFLIMRQPCVKVAAAALCKGCRGSPVGRLPRQPCGGGCCRGSLVWRLLRQPSVKVAAAALWGGCRGSLV